MRRQSHRFLSHAQSRGFTMIEVLVAVVVLSIGLLGLAALQLSSLQFNTNSYMRTQATVAVYDIIDRMRSNRSAFTNGDYNVLTASDAATKVTNYEACKASACGCVGTSCSATNLALYDLGQWYELMDDTLPGFQANRATITRNAVTNEVTIVINWVEKDVAQSKSWTVRL